MNPSNSKQRTDLRTVYLSALFFFLVMTALMILRPAREALGMQRGMDAVRWLFFGTAIVTLLVNPIFSFLVSRFKRLHFISFCYLFFAASLVGFWFLLTMGKEMVGEVSGQVFYIWFSVFNLFSVMIFWAFLADRFSLEESKRSFGIIAAGGTIGAITGSALASALAEKTGTPSLLLFSASLLVCAVICAWFVSSKTTSNLDNSADDEEAQKNHAIIGGSAWQGIGAVFKSKYLLGITAYMFILALMSTFVYFTRLEMVSKLSSDTDMRTGIFGKLDMYTQIATLVLQLGLTGFLMKRFGVSVTMAILPLTVMLGFIGLWIWATLAMVVILDAAAKAVQRAIMRPARETLFTVLNREDKYKAKAFVDTFAYRAGDVVGSQVEGLLKKLALGLMPMIYVALPLAAVWAVLGVWLGRQQLKKAQGDATSSES